MGDFESFQFSFDKPMDAWSTNDDRILHHFERHKYTTQWKSAARLAYIGYVNRAGAQRQLWPAIVQVTIPFDTKRKRDPHNYCGTVLKAVVDGLVSAGAWPDDDPRFVGHREPVMAVGSGTVIVSLTPRDDVEHPAYAGPDEGGSR